MTAPPSRRPRPGPLRLLLLVAAVGVLLCAGFVALVMTDRLRAAAWVLLLLPVADLGLRLPPLGRYVERHAGAVATGHLLTAMWAAGVVSIASGTSAVRLAALVVAMAAVAAGVSRIVWARHPRELRARNVPGVPGDSRLPSAAGVAGWLVATAEVAATAVLAFEGRGVEVAVGVVAALEALAGAAAAALAVSRIVRGSERVRAALGPAVVALRPDVLVHFSGSIDTLYQLAQWMPLLARRRILLVLREDPVFEASPWEGPTVMVRDFPDLDVVVPPSARVAVYVNTGTKNNHLIRFGDLTHVQLHHGDSDKPFASSKPMRLYDHHVVAGPAGRDRIVDAGLVGPDGVSIVGRPQAAPLRQGPLGHARPVVVYAPTWEGFHLDTPYSSVGVLGEALVRAMPDGVLLVVRPHPLTGTVDRRLRAALARIERALAERGDEGRLVPSGEEPLAATLDRADLLIGDVSSVLVDFLAADRPAAVTDVEGIGVAEMRERFPSTAWAAVLAPDLGNLRSVLDDAFGDDARSPERGQARARLLGDIDDPAGRFLEVLDRLVAQGAEPTDR